MGGNMRQIDNQGAVIMKYIVHRRYKAKSLMDKDLNLPYGTECVTSGNFIMTKEGDLLCMNSSEVANRHFARNDDGNGLERGKLTYAISYDSSKYCEETRMKWTEEEYKCLIEKWSKFRKKETPDWVFNTDFYHADIEDLREMVNDLHIKIKN